MGLFEKIKNVTKSLLNGTSVSNGGKSQSSVSNGGKSQSTATNNNNPKGKPLEWFTSEAGLETFKIYTSPQNYMLEDTIKEEYKRKYGNSDTSFEVFFHVYHPNEKIPSKYFEALIDNIKVQPLKYVGPCNVLVGLLKIMAKSFYINDDGEPEICEPVLSPEQIVSVEKNPVLYFVKNFNIFELKDDALGTFQDKFALYGKILSFLAINAAKIDIAGSQWLFDKNTYINDFGVVRKEKGFLKKCKEVSGFTEYFDEQISQLD